MGQEPKPHAIAEGERERALGYPSLKGRGTEQNDSVDQARLSTQFEHLRMKARAFTLRLDPETGLFDDTEMRSFLEGREVLEIHQHV